MNRKIIACLFVLFIAFPAFAESVYLKDGTVVKGRIVKEDEKIILLDSGDTWKRIDKSNIEYINKDDQTTPMTPVDNKKETTQSQVSQKESDKYDSKAYSKSETVFKISIDGSGKHKLTNATVNGQSVSTNGTDQNVEGGIGLTFEHAFYPAPNLGLGFGITYQLPRSLEGGNGEFYFIPLYGLVRLRTTPTDDNSYFFGTVQLGINAYEGDDTYKGPSGELRGGAYGGIGIGYAFGGRFQLELLSTVDTGKATESVVIGASRYEVEADVAYSKLSLTLGLQF